MTKAIDRQLAVSLYQELGSQQRVAEAMGCSQGAVSTALRLVGLGKGLDNRRRHSDEELLRVFEEEGTALGVSRRFGMTDVGVAYRLRRMGVTLGPGGQRPIHALPMAEVIARYEAGESTGVLGQAYGVDPEVIRRRIARKGVQRRPVGPPSGAGNPQWKGGREKTMHYYRRQSYEVAAICLGQPVPQGWVIHHADENPQNNQPENLILFADRRDHHRLHQQLLRLQRAGLAVDATRTALESGGQALPVPPSPIRF